MTNPDELFVPSLEQLSLEVVAANDYWIVQKRHIQYLPGQLANALLSLLLTKGRLQSPVHLDLFRHSLTELHISGRHMHIQLGQEWVAYIADLRHLQHLSLIEAPRLKDRHLSSLTKLAGSLVSLDLSGCSGLTRNCLDVLQQLTGVQTLRLSGTSIRSPALDTISSLTALTQLHLGGCEILNDDIKIHITVLRCLQDLSLWGSAAGDTCVPFLAQLPGLQRLSMAWSQLTSVIPVITSLRVLDLSHCQLTGDDAHDASEQEACLDLGAHATSVDGASLQLREVHMVSTQLSAATSDLLEHLIRSSAANLRLLDLTCSSAPDLLPLLLAVQASTTLSALSLSGTHLLNDYCPTLTPCTALQALDLSQNPEVTAAGLAEALPVLGQLQRLNLAGTGISNNVLPVLSKLTSIEELVLADTAISWEWESPVAAVAGAAGTDGRQQPPQQQAAQHIAHGAAGAQIEWCRLRVLDISSSAITDAGCMQLAKQLTAAAAAARNNTTAMSDSNGGSGIAVLSIGSRKLFGRRGVAALSRVHSLQQLTLQGCELSDRDLRLLQPLQQLQQLHIVNINNWLLLNDAIKALPDSIPSLHLITRDRQVVFAADAAAQQGSGFTITGLDPNTSPLAVTSPTAVVQSAGESWLTAGLSGAATSGVSGPAAPLSQSSYLHAAVQTSTSSSGRQSARQRIYNTASSSRKATATSSGSSSKNANVYQRLSVYDERYRYSTEQLLSLRPNAGTAPSGSAEPGAVRSVRHNEQALREPLADEWPPAALPEATNGSGSSSYGSKIITSSTMQGPSEAAVEAAAHAAGRLATDLEMQQQQQRVLTYIPEDLRADGAVHWQEPHTDPHTDNPHVRVDAYM